MNKTPLLCAVEDGSMAVVNELLAQKDINPTLITSEVNFQFNKSTK